MVDLLLGQHLAHIGLASRIADHGRAAADQCNRMVAGLLQAGHNNQLQEMADVQRISRCVKTNIECSLMVIQQIADFFFVCALGD